VAHSDVGVVAADQYLATGGNDVSGLVDACINGCFATAGADGFNFGNGVGDLKQAAATGEERGQKVGTQTKAHNGNIVYVNDTAQLIDLLGCEELALIGNDDVRVAVAFFKKCKDIGFGRHNVGNRLKTDVGANDICTVAVIDRGLDEPNLHISFLIIESGNESVCGLGRTHCAVFKVQFSHNVSPKSLKFANQLFKCGVALGGEFERTVGFQAKLHSVLQSLFRNLP
jgi:hypothetical protein